jgi:hypothetical protein
MSKNPYLPKDKEMYEVRSITTPDQIELAKEMTEYMNNGWRIMMTPGEYLDARNRWWYVFIVYSPR